MSVIADPLLLDHSFPRSDLELAHAESALAALHMLVLEKEEACLIITDTFADLIEQIDWSCEEPDLMRFKTEIYRYLSILMLRQGQTIKMVNIVSKDSTLKHPLPGSATTGPLVDYWQIDVGNILQMHMSKIGSNFAVGVICSNSLTGGSKNCYHQSGDAFPIVSEADLCTLGSIFTYDCHSDILNQSVSFNSALKNVEILGATVRQPSGSSHWVASFSNSRSWPIDRNTDPLPERFVKQLTPILNKPYEYIHYVLITGKIPAVKFRLEG